MKLSGTKTTTEEISVDASNLQNELQLQISDLSEQIAELENKKPDLNTDLLSDISDSIVGQAEFLKELQSLVDLQAVKIKELESLNNSSNKIPLDTETFEAAKFEFVLGVDADGHYSDESWEEIIKKGQELQYAYYKAAEDKYSKIWPLFPGWHGSAMAPVIKIICEEPEYHFKDTKRLPGRF